MKNISLYFHKEQKVKANHGPPGQRSFIQLISKDPWVDWVMILSVSAIITAILIYVGVAVYIDSVGRLDAPPTTDGNIVRKFDVKGLQTITDTFDARARERVLLLQGGRIPSDPSLP